MTALYLLTDYRGTFESKYRASPYRSGFDQRLLAECFARFGIDARFSPIADVDFRQGDLAGRYVAYTSSEDKGLLYKQYIEDVVFGLEILGARLIPPFKFLRATCNKVFMEILRDLVGAPEVQRPRARCFGVLEDLARRPDAGGTPAVVKPSGGARSAGVSLANAREDLLARAAAVSRSPFRFDEAWDWGRSLKRPGYVRESRHRRKFIVQEFVSGLSNDWKVLVYGRRYYVLHRRNRKDDFRASGSGLLSYVEDIPPGLLEYAAAVADCLAIPCVSLDVGWDGHTFFLFEFQGVYFGTYTIEHAPFFYERRPEGWMLERAPSVVEEEYARSLSAFIIERESGRGRPHPAGA